LAEQNAAAALERSDRGYVIQISRLAVSGNAIGRRRGLTPYAAGQPSRANSPA
jgi:hypothetical protein